MNKRCQIFTPLQYVVELLDYVGYVENLYGKKVMENSCGDGNIILEVTKRYIEDSLKHNLELKNIKQGLENDIFAAEIDNIHHKNCIINLNKLAEEYGIKGVKWNVLNEDFLRSDSLMKFDYIIGNPPYIKYVDLDIETRRFLKSKFYSCKSGKFDYCYAFIEASVNALAENGKLAYLIPNSIFKNVFAFNLREFIKPGIMSIIDYTNQKLFQNASTSSAILIYQKNSSCEFIEYVNKTKNITKKIKKKDLTVKWIFSGSKSITKYNLRFGDYFKASMGVATLLNEVFVLNGFEKKGEYFEKLNVNIESQLIRKAASPRGCIFEKKELIIFPYFYKNKKLFRYSEKEFCNKFPNATKYLKKYENKLLNRNNDQSARWYEYGRSQALLHLNQPKLLISTLITNEVKVCTLDADSVPYSGIYIVKMGDLPLKKAKEILESEEFLNYINIVGINANNGSLRITVKDINDFHFN